MNTHRVGRGARTRPCSLVRARLKKRLKAEKNQPSKPFDQARKNILRRVVREGSNLDGERGRQGQRLIRRAKIHGSRSRSSRETACRRCGDAVRNAIATKTPRHSTKRDRDDRADTSVIAWCADSKGAAFLDVTLEILGHNTRVDDDADRQNTKPTNEGVDGKAEQIGTAKVTDKPRRTAIKGMDQAPHVCSTVSPPARPAADRFENSGVNDGRDRFSHATVASKSIDSSCRRGKLMRARPLRDTDTASPRRVRRAPGTRRRRRVVHGRAGHAGCNRWRQGDARDGPKDARLAARAGFSARFAESSAVRKRPVRCRNQEIVPPLNRRRRDGRRDLDMFCLMEMARTT